MTKLQYAIPVMGLALVLAGCAKDRHESIPHAADEVSEAAGDISFTAPQDGDVWVYDVGADELVYSGRIRKGETLSIEPEDDEDKIRLESQVVSSEDLQEGNKHKIFFQPSSRRERSADLAGSREGDVVREEKTTVIREAEPADTEQKKTVTTETETRTGERDGVIVKEKKTTETQP